MGIITCSNITKKFGDYTALNSVSLDIPQGQIFGLLGPNGAGKTTLIRIINQITLPTAASCFLRGRLCGRMPWRASVIFRKRGDFIKK